MDVRLNVQQYLSAVRPFSGRLREAPQTEVAIEDEEREAKESTRAKIEPPPMMSREELQQFLLLLGSTRGSEKLLAAMVHDSGKMRSVLLPKRG